MALYKSVYYYYYYKHKFENRCAYRCVADRVRGAGVRYRDEHRLGRVAWHRLGPRPTDRL